MPSNDQQPLRLTKSSETALRAYGAGHGVAFLSEGNDATTKSFDFGLYWIGGEVWLYCGAGGSVRLTPEQRHILGTYAGAQHG